MSSPSQAVFWTIPLRSALSRSASYSVGPPSLFTPRPVVELPWGSESISSTRKSFAASDAERLIAVVVLPTPPFWLAMAIVFGTLYGWYHEDRSFGRVPRGTVRYLDTEGEILRLEFRYAWNTPRSHSVRTQGRREWGLFHV